MDGVTLSSHGPNNDGCDPESCDGVWIRNCRFDTGDDCVSLKSGVTAMAGRPTLPAGISSLKTTSLQTATAAWRWAAR